jgi:carbamoyltransferase
LNNEGSEEMYILGINSAYHESAACLLKDGVIIAAAEEERFNRHKHAKPARVDNPDELPLEAIAFCLKASGITMQHVAQIGYSLNPQRRLQTKAFQDRVEAGQWGSVLGEDTYYQALLGVPDKLVEMGFCGDFEFLDHHLCHAASAFYPSPFAESAVLAVDGIGETGTAMLAYGDGTQLRVLQEIVYPASLGFLWEKLSKFIGFSEYDANKVMGLAAYGDSTHFAAQFDQLCTLADAGTFTLDNDILCFRVEDYAPLEALFRIPKRERGQELKTEHAHMAAALQVATDQCVLHMVRYLHEQTGSNNLCMAGGVALNCVTNQVVHEQGPFENLYIQPAAHDAGTALGVAFVLWHKHPTHTRSQPLNHAYLGPSFSDAEIEQVLQTGNYNYERVDDVEKRVAELIAQKKIVGWFQGALELGPRALGNRSLLAAPHDANTRESLNIQVKHREDFRPFAPSVLYEEVENWFKIKKETSAAEYMLMTYPVCEEHKEKIPAVLHEDHTSRIQAVRQEINPRYHKLISEFYRLTGIPLVLNTSFNDSEPIVCTPQDALNTFMKTQIDYLAIGSFLLNRQYQSRNGRTKTFQTDSSGNGGPLYGRVHSGFIGVQSDERSC